MPNKLRDVTGDIAEALSVGEPGMAAVRRIGRFGNQVVDTVNAGRKRLRQMTTPAAPAADIELPNVTGRIDPRLKKRRATRGAARR